MSSISAERRAKLPIRWGLIVLLVPVFLVSTVAAPLAVRILSLEAFESHGPSMEPTLRNGDRFAVDRSAYGLSIPLVSDALVQWAEPEVGDVVVVHSAFDQLDIVKRVVGVGGDRIEIRGGLVYRNGAAFVRRALGPCPDDEECLHTEERAGERAWITSRSELALPDDMPEVVVPPGHVFVLGDHRDRSNDSRNPRIGPVPSSRVRGRAVLIYWSSDEVARYERFGQEIR